jgi:omega-amidase
MQDLNVTLVQIDQIWEDKRKNLQKYEAVFTQLTLTDLVVLPEMFHTGFTMNVNELAEDWNNSEGLFFLKKWAKKINAAFYTSLIIRDNDCFRNRGVFIFPNGKVQFYDKRKSFGLAGEDRYYAAGNIEKIVEYKDWKINLQICYDLRFPELVRNRILNDNSPAYDLIIYIANWPEKRSHHWKSLLMARAIENQSYVIGVNRIGNDGKGLIYTGDSCIIDSIGQYVLNPIFNNEAIQTFCLSTNSLHSSRELLPFLIDAN